MPPCLEDETCLFHTASSFYSSSSEEAGIEAAVLGDVTGYVEEWEETDELEYDDEDALGQEDDDLGAGSFEDLDEEEEEEEEDEEYEEY